MLENASRSDKLLRGGYVNAAVYLCPPTWPDLFKGLCKVKISQITSKEVGGWISLEKEIIEKS